MTQLSRRDRGILAVTGVLLLYGLTAGWWFMSQEDGVARARKNWEKARATRQKEARLISQRAQWNADYEAEREKMPTFPEGESTDTYWLTRMDALAQANNVAISQRQGGKEEEVGDVLEQPIEVKNWEASLESLVKFVCALEKADGAMFDVRNLVIRPSSGHNGYLKGSFSLSCAYMRDGERGEPAKKTQTKVKR